MEKIKNQDEATLLGYFESLKGNFILKLIFLFSHVESENNVKKIDFSSIPKDSVSTTKEYFDDTVFYKALENGNNELVQNFIEDTVTALLMSSWNVFEQITKELTQTSYVESETDLSVCYQNSKFGFSRREKKDIELFYYIRNAICHYNGAYYSYRKIDHRYNGKDFKTEGNVGNKIEVGLELAWKIALDIETYTMTAWSSSKLQP